MPLEQSKQTLYLLFLIFLFKWFTYLFIAFLFSNNLPISPASFGLKLLSIIAYLSKTRDVLLRDLDCSVIEQIRMFKIDHNDNPFDSVRGVFVEGDPPYPGAEFRAKTHIQICVCNPNCIKGYFAPKELNPDYSNP